jgi:hypothetical protein
MTPAADAPGREQLEAVYRAESRAVLATLIRLLGDFIIAGRRAFRDAPSGGRERDCRTTRGRAGVGRKVRDP